MSGNTPIDSGLDKDKLNIRKLISSVLQLGDAQAIGISNELENAPDKLSTARALFVVAKDLQDKITAIDPTDNAFTDKSVITEPTVSPLLEPEAEWTVNGGFHLVNKTATFDGAAADPEGYDWLKIPSIAFPGNDHYLLKIVIDSLSECEFRLIDKDENILEVFTVPGTYFIEIDVPNSQSATFKIIPWNHSISSLARISYLGVHRIRERFYQYLNDKIQAIANIDGGGYTTKVYVQALLDDLDTKFTDIMTSTILGINGHIEDRENPHGVTYRQVDAAWSQHSHTAGELNLAPANHTHDPLSIGAAPVVHTHDEYVTGENAETIIEARLEDRINRIPDVDPLLILDGELGVVPNEFTEENIQAPVQLLKPSILYHDSGYAYDADNGLVSASVDTVDGNSLSKFMSISVDDFAIFEVPDVYIHYQFHTTRALAGYKIYAPLGLGKPIDWDLYTDLNLFIHHATARVEEYMYVFTFTQPVYCKTLSIHVMNVELPETITTWGIRLEPIFADVPAYGIGITDMPFKVSIPNHSSTQVYAILASQANVLPTEYIKDLPLHIYMDMGSGSPVFGYTYIPPEYGNVCLGTDLFRDKFNTLNKNANGAYTHPIFGDIQMVGVNNKDALLQVFSSVANSDYRSDDGVKRIDIEHNFLKPISIAGYKLEWSDLVRGVMPTSWSLEITALDDDLTIVNMVLDSVTVNKDIVSPYGLTGTSYYKKFDEKYNILQLRLCMRTTGDVGIGLTNYKPFVVEDFYSIPLNTMYHLDKPVKRVYLGIAKYIEMNTGADQRFGYVVENQVLGKHCTLSMNDLLPCTRFKEYYIPNPFNTKELTINFRVVYLGGEDYTEAPTAVVEEISSRYIKVRTYTEHRFVLDVMRNW